MLISVIVPVYNVEPYIHRCVDSILNQTFTDFELILVDDGSPDNCGKICDEYAEKDPRIHVIHQENGGLSAARNAGIDWAMNNSESEWLTFIDSDDWIHPIMLEKLYEANISNNTSVSSCSFVRTTGEKPAIDTNTIKTSILTPEKFYLENNVNATIACAKLYKKECFKSIRYPVGKLHEDEFTTYKILFEYDAISVVDASLYMYYINQFGIMNSEWTPKRLAALEAYEQQILFFETNHFANAAQIRKRDYLFTTHKFITIIQNNTNYNKTYRKEKHLLHNVLNDSIKKYKNDEVLSADEIEWMLHLIKPIRTKFKAYIKRIKILEKNGT